MSTKGTMNLKKHGKNYWVDYRVDEKRYYNYNERCELTNAVASIDVAYSFAYNYDDIGNRLWSVENTNETAYMANNLNQYTAIEEDADTFVPQFDADGNQTLIKTKSEIWSATYNGENRPIHWSNGVTNIVMSFDRMGRRVQYLEIAGATTNANNTFTYDNYLCVARYRLFAGGIPDTDRFVWNPIEPVATRPLVFNYATAPSAYYTQDGNKNVSELVRDSEDVVERQIRASAEAERDRLRGEVLRLKNELEEALTAPQAQSAAPAPVQEARIEGLLKPPATLEVFSGEVREHILAVQSDGLEAAQSSEHERRASVLEDVLAANKPGAELERRRRELKQIIKDTDSFVDARTIAALEKLGFKCVSGNKHWKLDYANVRIPISKTPSDRRGAQNTATDIANRCF